MNLTAVITVIGEIITFVGAIVPIIMWIKKVANGQRCQLRSEMLRIYYRNKETEKIIKE